MFEDLRNDLRTLQDDLLHKTVRLGVTGLSHAGKTTFITALIYRLKQKGWLQAYSEMDGLAKFDWDANSTRLRNGQWPASTTESSGIRLKLYVPTSKRGEKKEVFLEIIDYPGEWLLDLGMAESSYRQWSAEFTQYLKNTGSLDAEWVTMLHRLAEDETKCFGPDAANALSNVAETFSEWLDERKGEGYSFIQPGRFLLLPQDGSSPFHVRNFVPWIGPVPKGSDTSSLLKCTANISHKISNAMGHLPHPRRESAPSQGLSEEKASFFDKTTDGPGVKKDSDSAITLFSRMAANFNRYREEYAVPFRRHFKRLNRQVVLIDVMGALQQGDEAWEDLLHTLGRMLKFFSYGSEEGLLRTLQKKFANLWHIDRVLFAMTKADHFSTGNATDNLLNTLVRDIADRAVDRAGCVMERKAESVMNLASVASIPPFYEFTLENASTEAQKKYIEQHGSYCIYLPEAGRMDIHHLLKDSMGDRPRAALSAFCREHPIKECPPPCLNYGDTLPNRHMDEAISWILSDILNT